MIDFLAATYCYSLFDEDSGETINTEQLSPSVMSGNDAEELFGYLRAWEALCTFHDKLQNTCLQVLPEGNATPKDEHKTFVFLLQLLADVSFKIKRTPNRNHDV